MLPKYYEFFCPVKILSGRKALSNLPYELSQLGSTKCLIVTDKGVVGAKLIELVKTVFADSDCVIGAIFEDTPVDSSNRVVNEIAKIYKANSCDSIVAVGGGSAIDTAKGVNIVISENTDDLLKLQGVDRIKGPMEPFIVVPTTAGTGSEVTTAAIIYNEDARVKMAFMSHKLYPNIAILDPEMTRTMPPRITAASGMDALTHAIEAYYCLQKNPVSDAYAAAAIHLIRDNLPAAVEHGDNIEARMAMANAALLAGMAFSNSMVGIVHSLAHACGGVAHVAHGIANSILLPFGMEYNIDRVPDYLAEVALLFDPTLQEKNSKQLAQKAVNAVRDLAIQLNKLCDLPLTLSQARVSEDQLEKIAQVSINDGAVTYNPEDVTYDEALAVLKKAF
ncbi:iron-containing alcohol dehydrogenase [candidate division CSSED10-310 bacterium]|uniref:Iron-containing alcohol dehydrogenase n=1 Tax=candidate division CSSED10-310 bacterium TaxID=2855610 RepID=A0ABV6YSH2_UNCC1